jgi:CHASE1-domain containing sensor protein
MHLPGAQEVKLETVENRVYPTSELSDETELDAFRFSIGDLIIVLVALICFSLCLTAALLSYFLVQKQEIALAMSDLEEMSILGINNINKGYQSTRNTLAALQSLFNVTDSQINTYTQFLPFVYATGTFPEYIYALVHMYAVPDADRDAFEAKIRTLGPQYTNYYIYAKAANGSDIPSPHSIAVHYPVVEVAPWSPEFWSSIGYDHYSAPPRAQAINNAFNTREPSATSKVTFVTTTAVPGCAVYAPIFDFYNQSVHSGIAESAVLIGDLIQQAMTDLSSQVNINVIDMNATDPDTSFLYNSELGTSITFNQSSQYINEQPFYVNQTIRFYDRIWSVTFMPTDSFMAAHNTVEKYIGIIVSSIVFLILMGGCIILFFIKHMQRIVQSRQKGIAQIGALKEKQTGLNDLLRRITVQEQRARATIDAIPDIVILLDYSGRIVHSNSTFDELFGFDETTLQKGVFIGTAFPDTEFGFFRNIDGDDVVTTMAKTIHGRFQAEIKVRRLGNVRRQESSQKSLVMEMDRINQEEEAYIVIAKKVGEMIPESQ